MNDSNAYEVNFDGIVGLTHTYGGLSYGNIASQDHRHQLSNPKEAALQGLEKMKFLADLGIKQAVLPPQERPYLPALRALGFSGSNAQIIKTVWKEFPELLIAVSSAASMWTANAATVSPSPDSQDHRVHFTAANLSSKFHRAIETSLTSRLLKAIFKDSRYFVHHSPLPSGTYFADEGAANHTRFCKAYGQPGVELFVFGRSGFSTHPSFLPKRFPARQTQEASQAIARLHQLNPQAVVFAQQHPNAIDAGAFHNDVVSVGNENLFFYHEQAFVDSDQVIHQIQETVLKHCQSPMNFLKVKAQDIPLQEAISSYLFNSQIVRTLSEGMHLIAPIECQENSSIHSYLTALISHNHQIKHVSYLNLRQSMRNGGGPACLRLRVVLTLQEIAAVHAPIFLDDRLYQQLKTWIAKHYRDRLHPHDLADPQLLEEEYRALDELTTILKLGSLYDFQLQGNQ